MRDRRGEARLLLLWADSILISTTTTSCRLPTTTMAEEGCPTDRRPSFRPRDRSSRPAPSAMAAMAAAGAEDPLRHHGLPGGEISEPATMPAAGGDTPPGCPRCGSMALLITRRPTTAVGEGAARQVSGEAVAVVEAGAAAVPSCPPRSPPAPSAPTIPVRARRRRPSPCRRRRRVCTNRSQRQRLCDDDERMCRIQGPGTGTCHPPWKTKEAALAGVLESTCTDSTTTTGP